MKHLSDISKTLGYIIGILTALWLFGEPFLEDYVDDRVDERAVSPELITKIMMSPFMIDQKRNEKNSILSDALHKSDSLKVKLSSSLVVKTGMNKNAMADTLANMIKIHCLNKKYVTKEECILNSKEYGRSSRSMSPM